MLKDTLTLGDYRDICVSVWGDDNKGVRFLDRKIAASPQGRGEVVVAPEEEMMQILTPLLKQREDSRFVVIDGKTFRVTEFNRRRYLEAARDNRDRLEPGDFYMTEVTVENWSDMTSERAAGILDGEAGEGDNS